MKDPPITCGSLFSGICDGFGLAAQWAGMSVLWQVEIEKKAHPYLAKNFPDSERFYDIRDCGARNLRPVDIVFGGDPCQNNSVARHKSRPKNDSYHWAEMLRIIRELRPNWVLNENVVGSIYTLALDKKITDLEAAGYTTRAFVIPALAVGAAHRRDRVWLVAHRNAKRLSTAEKSISQNRIDQVLHRAEQRRTLFPQANRYDSIFVGKEADPELFGEVDGISDKLFKIKGLGNALVPQIPFIILSYIQLISE